MFREAQWQGERPRTWRIRLRGERLTWGGRLLSSKAMHDLVVRGGTLIDGTGTRRYTGDIAIDDGRLTQVGGQAGRGHREIAADGLLVAPGWVDIHTHYDGQATWDPEVSPSSWHGVTTVVMGNCGVGFAPVRPGQRDFLIELMEGVEDIPGTALHEGIDWQWESFPEYMDALERMPRVLDVGAMVPHCAVRAYVMGERAHELEVSDSEIEEMSRLTEEALAAGAMGFSTSRTILHRSRHGLVPGTYSTAEELLGIGRALGRVAGSRVFEMVTDSMGREPDLSWIRSLARETGCVVTFAIAQQPNDPEAYRLLLERADELTGAGERIVPQVPCRPTGMLFGLQSTSHPFVAHPSYQEIAGLPLAERVARLSDPGFRARLLAEETRLTNPIAKILLQNYPQMFPLGDPPNYEPHPETSVAAEARRTGRRSEEVVLDHLLADQGRAFLFAPLLNYVDGNLDALREMITHRSTVLGLSDGGAHCGLICDAGMPTWMLAYWGRDRTRGAQIDIETLVRLQTSRTAEVFGMADRGRLVPGLRADLNLIDLDRLGVEVPEMVFDLPASGRRIVQRARGYRATIVAGEVTFEEGRATGARPGRLVRSGVAAPH